MSTLNITLHMTNKDWSYVYNSMLAFLNQEIKHAYDHATTYFTNTKDKKLTFAEIQEDFNSYASDKNLTEYQLSFIKRSIFSGTSQKLYKPKKLHFQKLTNRTTFVDTGIFQVTFDKQLNFVGVTSIEFENLDDFIREQSFLSEFINMVNTINWPTKPGPSKPVRGCVMTVLSKSTPQTFYKAGPNPALYSGAEDITVKEPGSLTSSINRNVTLVSKEVHIQPVETPNNLEDF
jgi:hypothetical protein